MDLPAGELPTSADDVITDDEVEALFGRRAVDTMNGEGPEEEGEGDAPDGETGTPGPDGTLPPPDDAEQTAPGDMAPAPDAAPGDATEPAEDAAPAEEPAAPDADDGWQDLNSGDDEL